MKPTLHIELVSLSLDVHGLIVPRGVKPHQLRHRDGQPHRVGPLGLHDVSHRADQVLQC